MNRATLTVYCPRCGGPATLTAWASSVVIMTGSLRVTVITDDPDHTCPDPDRDEKRRP